MKFATWMLSLFSLASLFFGCSGEVSPSRVKILDYGLYEGDVIVRKSSEGELEHEVVAVAVRAQPKTTTTVPRQPKTYFGFRLDPATLPSNYRLRLEYEHPAFENKKGERLEFEEYDVKAKEDFDGEIIYCFIEEAPYEMVPGTWTFRVLMDGQVVAQKSFEVQ